MQICRFDACKSQVSSMKLLKLSMIFAMLSDGFIKKGGGARKVGGQFLMRHVF